MVRRAATEALCNMASHPEAVKNFRSQDKLKFWLALACDWEGDMPTATAAAGALAMVASDRGGSSPAVSRLSSVNRGSESLNVSFILAPQRWRRPWWRRR
jgi:hypothetical protein